MKAENKYSIRVVNRESKNLRTAKGAKTPPTFCGIIVGSPNYSAVIIEHPVFLDHPTKIEVEQDPDPVEKMKNLVMEIMENADEFTG